MILPPQYPFFSIPSSCPSDTLITVGAFPASPGIRAAASPLPSPFLFAHPTSYQALLSLHDVVFSLFFSCLVDLRGTGIAAGLSNPRPCHCPPGASSCHFKACQEVCPCAGSEYLLFLLCSTPLTLCLEQQWWDLFSPLDKLILPFIVCSFMFSLSEGY